MANFAKRKDASSFDILYIRPQSSKLNQLCIYVPQDHPRLAYLANFLRDYLDNVQIVITQNESEYLNGKGISIQYGLYPVKPAAYVIYNSGKLLLSPQELLPIPYRFTNKELQFYPDPESDGFDLFAALFVLLARIEEYEPDGLDEFGRYPASKNILVRLGQQEIPVVDQWMHHFIDALNQHCNSNISARKCRPSWSIGLDVDHFYKHLHKGPIKTWGGILKAIFRGDLQGVRERVMVLRGYKPDPYDCFKKLKSLSRDGECWLSFILSGGHSSFDKNQTLLHPAVKQNLRVLSEFSEIGLHPSFSSNDSFQELQDEKVLLENQLGRAIHHSRQHYLKLRLPQTYHRLLACHIRNDYSMGFAEVPGFRAGIARPYFWYDLQHEMETGLRIHPFAIMDRTCLSYMKWSPQQSINSILSLYECTVKYGGHFQLIWHNSSFDFDGEWHSWEGVFESLLEHFRGNSLKT